MRLRFVPCFVLLERVIGIVFEGVRILRLLLSVGKVGSRKSWLELDTSIRSHNANGGRLGFNKEERVISVDKWTHFPLLLPG